jgi:cation diffusion facilitator family transporter
MPEKPMTTHDLDPWTHSHDYGTESERRAEQRTRWVVALTLATMVVELIAGWLTGSMALLADGWHMGSHAAALGVAAYAYRFARHHRADPRFSFGTGKVSSLAGYSSAMLLGAGALWMLVESVLRLIEPHTIRYADALLVAALGLVVNLVSAWLLGGSHEHPHDHDHGHHPGHHHHDHNLRAAYLHVLADALTSVLALIALGLGMTLGWAFLDPMMGIAGSLLVGHWALRLAQSSALVLLDAGDIGEIAGQVRSAIEDGTDNEIADLHLWRIGPAGYACIISLVTHQPRPVEHYRTLLSKVPGLRHITVEVNHCRNPACDA